MANPEVFATEGLRLRELRADDIDHLVELDSDPEVMRYLTAGRPVPRWVYEDFLLQRCLDCGQGRPGLGMFVIEAGSGREFTGWVMLRPDHWQPQWLEIGYRLRRRAWGRGIGSAVAAQMRDRALQQLAAPTVCARTMPDNLASRRVMEKIGLRFSADFTFPATSFAQGRFHYPELPGVLYTLSDTDWHAHQQAATP